MNRISHAPPSGQRATPTGALMHGSQLTQINLSRVLIVALVLLAQACVVNIEDKKGVGLDPCDPNPCQKTGVCADWTGTCKAEGTKAVCSAWKPKTGTGDTPPGYEAAETLCDGKDNDCDGLTDEGLSAAADACPQVGVCSGVAIAASCVGGNWACNLAVVPAYEASETTCDGKDNDCDGETDEQVVPAATSCKRAGVCASVAPPACADGAWQCHYGDAKDYEQAETLCDGKDNDCDGHVDGNLSPTALPDGKSCANVGVCKDAVKIACQGGAPTCDFGDISGWEPFETQCDGKDNDCDGKTDNVQGTAASLLDADIAECAKNGVCKAASAGQITRTCTGAQWTCSYSGIANYELSETLCDGKDNDCDGAVDAALPAPALSPCGDLGVCKGIGPTCAAGVWSCDIKKLTEAGYEKVETACDGKDNDCDGSTDETVAPYANGCVAKGVCAVGAQVSCTGGKATCNYSAVLGYEAVTETTCDGKDNDCDGETDEAAGLDVTDAGCTKGVCAGAAKASCAGGAWLCDYSAVAAYEKNELSCDNNDNDCDGQTDEGLGAAIASKCNTAGVCSVGIVAACVAGKAICAYQSVDHQGVETLCDGKDNDCDGTTDTGLCKTLQTCDVDTSCVSSACVSALGGSSKVCAEKIGQCARVVGGKTTLTEATTTVCADDSSTLTCSGGSFGAPTACPQDKPACSGGTCALCIAGQKRCDVNNKADVLLCALDGSKQEKSETCSTGRCAGHGVCVVDGVIAVTTGTADADGRPAIAAVGSGFAVAWLSAQAFSDSVRMRLFDATGKGSAAVSVSGLTAPDPSRNPVVASNGPGFVVVWQAAAGAKAVYARQYDAKGAEIGNAFPVSSVGESAGQPAVAGNADGFVVAYGVSSAGSEAVRILRFNKGGNAVGTALTASTADNGDALSGSHGQPAIALASDGAFVVAWTRSQSAANDGVWWRRYDKSGVATSSAALGSAGGKSVADVRVVARASGWAIAWAQTGTGDDGVDVGVLSLGADGKATFGPALSNITKSGAQNWPALAAGVGRVVIGWAAAAADGGDVMGRDLLDSGTYASTTDVGLTPTSDGIADHPALLAYTDGRVVVVWRQRTNASDQKSNVQATFR